MGSQFGWQNLFLACQHAAGSTEAPQRRLAAIVRAHVIPLQREHLPDQYSWERVVQLIGATTRTTSINGKRSIEVYTASMTTSDATAWLANVVSLFGDVAEACRTKSRPIVMARRAAAR
jgi:hypothetical protein